MALLADDLELMPNDCINLLLSFAQPKDGPGGSAIILTSSGTELSRPDLAEFAALGPQHDPPAAPRPRRNPPVYRAIVMDGRRNDATTDHARCHETSRRPLRRGTGRGQSPDGGGVHSRLRPRRHDDHGQDRRRRDRARRAANEVTAPTQANRPAVLARDSCPLAALGLLVVGASAFLYKALTEKPAPKPPVVVQRPVEPPPPAKPAETLPPSLMAALTKRGNEALDLGDTASARLLFQRAAEAGSGAAAIALGKTYDPNFTANVAARDPDRAAEWYRKAAALGDPAAAELLKRLGAR